MDAIAYTLSCESEVFSGDCYCLLMSLEMFLILRLGKKDVLPLADLGLKNAMIGTYVG